MKRKVLALNRAMIPVEFKDAKDAFRIVCKQRAFIFDTNWARYTLDEWILSNYRELGEFGGSMNTVNFNIPLPPAIVLDEYDRVQRRTINPNRENVWKRDGAKCAYCKVPVRLKDATLDHVYPRSKGGPDIWENLVCACQPCNHKKDDELLHDIHDMELMVKPFAPNPTSILYDLSPQEIENMPEFWKHFFVEFK